jgi:hypothetical protein
MDYYFNLLYYLIYYYYYFPPRLGTRALSWRGGSLANHALALESQHMQLARAETYPVTPSPNISLFVSFSIFFMFSLRRYLPLGTFFLLISFYGHALIEKGEDKEDSPSCLVQGPDYPLAEQHGLFALSPLKRCVGTVSPLPRSGSHTGRLS